MFVLQTTTDQIGGIYPEDQMMPIGEFHSIEAAFRGLEAAIIPGVRGPGCFAISGPDGIKWVSDPRGIPGKISGLVQIDTEGEIIKEWMPA